MAMKFVAPVIVLALLVIASSTGNLHGEKSGACALIFPLCDCRVPMHDVKL